MEEREYHEFIQSYNDAMQVLLTRVHILEHSLYDKTEGHAIQYVTQRIKKKQSIEDKLQKKGLACTVENAKNYLRDIAGIRVICYFVEDIYRLIDVLKRQPDLLVLRERDYIEEPKKNGYRSYHVVLGVPVCGMDAMEYFPVEVQFRTIAMDFWASMEHRISYKKHRPDQEQVTQELLTYADLLSTIEKSFEKYNETSFTSV